MNVLEKSIVEKILADEGVRNYSLRQGNNCIWATYGYINEYFIFSNGKLVDRQVD